MICLLLPQNHSYLRNQVNSLWYWKGNSPFYIQDWIILEILGVDPQLHQHHLLHPRWLQLTIQTILFSRSSSSLSSSRFSSFAVSGTVSAVIFLVWTTIIFYLPWPDIVFFYLYSFHFVQVYILLKNIIVNFCRIYTFMFHYFMHPGLWVILELHL